MSVARGGAKVLMRLGLLGLLALQACAPYKLQPLAESDTSGTGIRISVKTAQHDFFLQLLNRSARMLIVVPSAIELFFNGDRLSPEASSESTSVAPGDRATVKLTFDADLDDPDPQRSHALLLDKGLRLGSQPAGFDAVRLVAQRRAHFEPERIHFSILSGFALHAFYRTPFYSGFTEFRLGGRKGSVEITGRVRFHAGRSQSNVPFVHASAGLGILYSAHPRIRVGGAFGLLPSIFTIVGPTSGGLYVVTFDLHAELVADLIQRPAGAMVLSTRFGMTGDLFGKSHPYLIGPSLLIGLGYRFP